MKRTNLTPRLSDRQPSFRAGIRATDCLAIATSFLLAMAICPTAYAQDAVDPVEAVEPLEEQTAPSEPEAEATDKEAFQGNLRVRMLGTAPFVDGDAAQFQQRNQVPENFSGGIDEFHYDTEIAEDTELDLDGRAIFNNHDYLLSLSILNEDKGFLKLGYRQFRTWQDGRGGYYPPDNAQFVVFHPQLGVDRGEAWARGGLNLPQGFKLTVGYRYLFREGTTSSTEWGNAALPGGIKSIVPAFYNLDENRHQVDVALLRETDTSEVGGAFRYEYSSLDDRKNVTRDPGSLTAERRFTQRDNSKSDMFGARVHGTRRLLEDKVIVSGAYAYNNLDLSLGGSRIYGSTFSAGYNPGFANRQQRDEGFLNLAGSGKMREHVGNMTVAARPFADFQILSALRIRGEERDSNANFTGTNVGSGPAYAPILDPLQTFSNNNELSYAEEVELRYSGVDNLVLYSRAQWEQNNGDYYENEIEPVLQVMNLERATRVDRRRQKYAVGSNYYATRWMSLSSGYSYRISDYSYNSNIDSTPNDAASNNRYPAYLRSQDFKTHDISLRTTFRLPHNVGLVARYDWLQSTIETRADLLDSIQSAQSRAHVLGGTLTWNPADWWWAQGGANYVISTTDTGANNYNTPVAPYFRSFDNNYVTANLGTGAALDDKTDLDLFYNWVSADNYTDYSASSLSYGSRFQQNGVGIRASRRIDEHTKISAGYGFTNNDESFAGGNYNYDAHVLTTSVEFEY